MIRDNDPYCRGIVLLGLEAPEAELEAAFAAAAGEPLVKGFAVGRTIFDDAARNWLNAGSMPTRRQSPTWPARFRRLVECVAACRARFTSRLARGLPMSFTETEIRSAGRAIALGDEQVEGLLAVLRARPSAIGAAPAAPRAYERVRFDLVHLLWYTGALIVMGAMGLFSTLAFEQMGGAALTITALIYAALFTAGGHYLWHRGRCRRLAVS